MTDLVTGAPIATPAAAPAVTTRRVTAGFGWLALCQYSNRFLGLASTLILAKILTPSDFGLVAVASMMIEVIQLLRDMGLSEAVIYSRREDRAALDTAHTILVAYNILLFALAAAAAPFVASFYGNSALVPIILLMSSNLVVNSLRLVPLTLIRKNLQYRKLVLPDVVPVTVSSVLAIVMAFAGFGVWSLVAKTMVQSVLALALIQMVLPYQPRFRYDREAARELFHYGKFIVGSSILFVALYNVDRFFVSKIAGIAAFGAFELAARIAEVPAKQFSGLVGAVMFPVFSTLDGSRRTLQDMFLRTLKYTAAITFPAALILSTFGPALIDAVYGSQWETLGVLLRLLALSAALRSASSIIHDLFKATGNPNLMQRATVLKLASVAGLGAPAVYLFGAPGIAGLVVVTYAVVLWWELTRVSAVLDMPLSRPVRLLIAPIGASVAIIPAVYVIASQAFSLSSAWQLTAAIVLSGGAYALALLWLDKDVARDLRKLRTAVRRRTPLVEPGAATGVTS